MEPAWRNFFENHATVQFQHRMGAYLLLAYVAWHAWTARSVAPGSKAAKRAVAIVGLVLTQAVIGIATLLLVDGRIPLGWGLLHQGFAIVVLGMATAHWRALAVR
jgi:heme a synthase